MYYFMYWNVSKIDINRHCVDITKENKIQYLISPR